MNRYAHTTAINQRMCSDDVHNKNVSSNGKIGKEPRVQVASTTHWAHVPNAFGARVNHIQAVLRRACVTLNHFVINDYLVMRSNS